MKSKHRSVVHKILRKSFGNLQVVDAKVPLLLVPTEDDFKSAIRKDPRNCGLSRCVSRMFGASLALFFKKTSYVDIVDEDGIRRVHRYMVAPNAFSQVAAFDRGDQLMLGRSITLRPPTPSLTLAGARRLNKRWRKSDVAKALAAERKAQSSLAAATREAERSQVRFDESKEKAGASSPKLKLDRKQVDIARTQLRKAREELSTAASRANELRKYPFRPGSPPKPRHYDLTVRNASGYFARVGGAA